MPQTNSYPIRCPKCGSQQDELLYDSIDVGKEPDLRRQLLENKLNAVTCNECGHQFRIDKNLLYHDSRAGWMIYMNPTSVEKYDEAESEFRQVLDDLRSVMPSDQKMPEVDLVLSRIELVERIFVREAGFHPKVIEYVKYLIYTQNLDQFLPEDKALLLNGQECNEEQLCFVVQDVNTHKLETLMHYKREAYDSLLELLQQDGELSLANQLFPGPYVSARAYLMQEDI
ncbi:MAG: CpXC domain-containing protein [Verrucomicrobia bacterium]|nr:CpXC domain-containing protein [Verrucomicrobiota bacterium]MCH8513594.1 CpXC domain-containing protein [Kiritimatiellia bacterium]